VGEMRLDQDYKCNSRVGEHLIPKKYGYFDLLPGWELYPVWFDLWPVEHNPVAENLHFEQKAVL
jgi:hypothetical protein